MPERIQRKRTRGWRLPPRAVVVSRPTRWRNPFPVGGSRDRAAAAAAYRDLLAADEMLRAAARAELAGMDLVCWCPPGEPCHADVVLEIANQDPTPPRRP
jgi:hypothetical protein